MATEVANREEGNSQIRKSINDWKYPKIPIDQVYKKRVLKISPSYAVKDFEDTITVNSNNKSVSSSLLSTNFLEGFIKKQHSFLHLGMVQIAVKPLMRDGLGAPLVVSLRDARHLNFQNSLLAFVKTNVSQGPFYFECFPSFSVSLDDDALLKVLMLDVETGGIPLALTYRVVCKAMVDLSPEALKEPVLGETTYFQPAIGTRCITKWDEADLQVHESTTNEVEPKPDDRVLKKGSSISAKFGSEKESSSKNRTSLEDWNYPKTPVKQVYNSRKHYMYMDSESSKGLSLWSKAKIVVFQTSPPTVKDYEKTVTLKANDQINVPINLLEGLIKGEKRYIHLGLFQIAIKPFWIDELEAPVIVCVRDGRMIKFQESLNALVKANLSEGPFYFSCSPGHSICSEDHKFFKVNVMSGVPLVLTYRVVCNVTTGLTSDYRNSLTRGETTYYQSNAGTERTTIWDEVQLPESWTCS